MPELHTVYIVLSGRWEDHHIQAVFTNKDRAKIYADTLTQAGKGRYGDTDDIAVVQRWIVDTEIDPRTRPPRDETP